MSQYGILLPGFWDGETGRAIAAHGGVAAQVVAVYLMANQDTTMIGLYPIELVVMQARIRTLKPRQIASALDALRTARFAEFDPVTGYVWVREMAKFRLGLHVSPLKPSDKRVEGCNRLYRAARPNPFLGPFHDRYVTDLHLSERRDYTPDPSPEGHPSPSEGGSEGHGRGFEGPHTTTGSGAEGASKGLRRGFEASKQIRSEQIREQGSGTGTQDQDPRAGARRPFIDFRSLVDTRRHLRAATHALLEDDPTLEDGELADLVKVAASKLGVIDYDGRDIERLCASVRGERARRRA